MPQDFRVSNVDALIIAGVNGVDLKAISEEYASANVEPEMIKKMYQICKKKGKYVPFIIDMKKPEDERYKCGWTKYFNIHSRIFK